MHALRELLQDLFGFSERETRGFFLLLALLFGLVALSLAWASLRRPTPTTARDAAQLDSLFALLQDMPTTAAAVPSYFAFDPNTATLQDWQTLGVPEPLAQRILNYRQKGGQFRKAEDVQKIYGFPEETFQKLEPYIQISAVSALDNAPKNAPLTRFDLNEADTTTLKKIRGIGSGYAKRIVEWRQKLGGFYRVEQVAELYRFPPETFQELAKYAYLESPALRQIPINTADVATLQAHPYLSYKQAQALVRYRTEHGLFNSPDDLVKVRVLDAQAIERLKPYLKF
ncbi:MAG: ComEA family DNA-binding protein [Bernardetiaceae bacterium]